MPGDLFTSDVPAWDKGPRCPREGCGGAAVPVYDHHLPQVRRAGEVTPCPRCERRDEDECFEAGCQGAPRPPEANLACARCNTVWSGTADAILAARSANDAWKARNGLYDPKGSRSEWEAKRLADEAAKVARLQEGRW